MVEPRGTHRALVHASPRQLTASVGPFLEAGILRGAAVIVIATPEHAGALQERIGTERVLWLDAGSMVDLLAGSDGAVDPARAGQVMGDLVREATKVGPLWLFGEMAALLVERGEMAAALHLETLWNELARSHDLHRLCGYTHEAFERAEAAGLHDVFCAEHELVEMTPARRGPVLQVAT
jgi:hypothetical protein